MKRYLIIVPCLLLISPFLGSFHPDGSQDESALRADPLVYWKGRAVDPLAGRPVAFTHVVNTNRNTATICDTLGYFFLRVRRHDTLNLTAIGYAPLELVINDSLLGLNIIPDIYMQNMTYSIQGVMINPLGSYQSFRHKVINLELEPEYEINPTVITRIDQGTDTLDMMPTPSISPVTALYNWLSREGRQNRRYRKVIEQEQFEKEISYKYSPLIVSGITGYAGLELYAFMDFCKFSNKFLEESDRYEIRDAVVEKQIIYEALKKD